MDESGNPELADSADASGNLPEAQSGSASFQKQLPVWERGSTALWVALVTNIGMIVLQNTTNSVTRHMTCSKSNTYDPTNGVKSTPFVP